MCVVGLRLCRVHVCEVKPIFVSALQPCPSMRGDSFLVTVTPQLSRSKPRVRRGGNAPRRTGAGPAAVARSRAAARAWGSRRALNYEKKLKQFIKNINCSTGRAR